MAFSRYRKTVLVYSGIVAFSAMFLLPFLGSVNLFDSDEINYAESAREMIVTGDYMTVQIDYEPFPEKPPLFFWLQVRSMKLFGVGEFAARFPNVICGILSLVILYMFGSRLYGHRFGLLWILSYGAAILPFFYFKSGIIDPWFNLFTFVGFSLFIFYLDPVEGKKRLLNLMLSALFLGLAVLTKGPVAVLIFVICFAAFFIFKRFKLKTSVLHVILFVSVLTATGGSWYFYQLWQGNIDFLQDFLQYHIRLFAADQEFHRGFFGYHLVVLLLGVFPASVLALKSFTKKTETTERQRIYRQWMYLLLWTVILLFSLAKTKLLHYSSLAYFPVTFLAAWVWDKWIDRKLEIGGWQVALILMIALIYSAAAILFPLVTDHYDWLLSREFTFLDQFTREAIQRNVHWSGYEWLIGLFLMVGVVVASIRILRRNLNGVLILHLVVLLFSTASIYTFTERIEGYSQRSAIKFFQGLKGQDVHVKTLGYKSFAHLFYFDKPPTDEDESVERLMRDDLSKDAYFVMKSDKKVQYLQRYPSLEILYEKDGYVFTLKRAGLKEEDRISIHHIEEHHRVDIQFGESFFTTYRYEPSLEKPVLYPIIAPGGKEVTRGYPLEPRQGERADHPHHAGCWFNFGDVNGYDFWNNASSVPDDRRGEHGRIVHKEVTASRVIGSRGTLEVKMEWVAPDNDQVQVLLEEQTRFEFQGRGSLRVIDRITTLTALNREVVFTDNKEGLFAIRVDRAFELPSDAPVNLTDEQGIPSDKAVLDNKGVHGWYYNSMGEEGNAVWGKKAEWVKLTADTPEGIWSMVMMDHPGNPGYPSCWHARGYGLFSVNNLGAKVFDPALEPFRLTLKRGESVTFRHRLLVASRDLSVEEIEINRVLFIQD